MGYYTCAHAVAVVESSSFARAARSSGSAAAFSATMSTEGPVTLARPTGPDHSVVLRTTSRCRRLDGRCHDN